MRLSADTVVVGAGPVGMVTAIALAKNGTVIILEKNVKRPQQSRAIGITPPSLGVFERLGFVEEFLKEGVKVIRVGCYSSKHRLGGLDFTGTNWPYPFIVAIPQDRTECILEMLVLKHHNIQFIRGAEATGFTRNNNNFTVFAKNADYRIIEAQCRFIAGCDGIRSVIRQSAGITFQGRFYHHTFLMADYSDTTDWHNEARLYFTRRGSVESFPLPGKKRRFVLRTKRLIKEHTNEIFAEELFRRCGIVVDQNRKYWESAFGVQHFMASSYAVPMLYLCGDAAHVMSPTGGQNMNIGFADAECAAWIISLQLKNYADPNKAAVYYDRYRRISAKKATMRAGFLMNAGTSGGLLWSKLRNVALRIILNTPIALVTKGIFTMYSLPNRDFPSYKPRLERELA